MRYLCYFILYGLSVMTTITAEDTTAATKEPSPATTPAVITAMDPNAPLEPQLEKYRKAGDKNIANAEIVAAVQQWLKKDATGHYRVSQILQLPTVGFTYDQCVTIFGKPSKSSTRSLLWGPIKRTEAGPWKEGPNLIREDRTVEDADLPRFPIVPDGIYRTRAVAQFDNSSIYVIVPIE